MKNNVLIINSNINEAEEIRKRMSSSVVNVICVTTMSDALKHFISIDFCLVILDAHMSAEDDHKLLKAMRTSKSTPILVLSSKTDHSHRIHALQAGAHAYMGQPYSHDECLAQAHSLMQLYDKSAPQGEVFYTLACGDGMIIDPSTRRVFLHGRELKMTRKEFDLLFCLASNPGKVFSREQLYEQIWNDQAVYNIDDVVKHHIKTLRKKLTITNAEYIKNIWGIGYRFEDDRIKAEICGVSK